MDHEQEKFYEAEEEQAQAETQPMDDHDDVNDMVYFIELLKHLRILIERGSRVPLTGKALVDVESCLRIIDEMDVNLPDAIQYGMQMYSEKQRIMGDAETAAISRVTTAEMKANKALENARREAEQMIIEAEDEAKAILDDAQERADHMISDSEIVRQARDEARSIKNDARVEAGEMRLKASHDVYRMMTEVEGRLDETLKEMRRLSTEMTSDVE
jgi:vacuolar-type H+-ATPase subunit H